MNHCIPKLHYFNNYMYGIHCNLISFNTSIPSYMSETFPEYSNEGCNVVWCLSDITVFPEESVVPLHYAPKTVNQEKYEVLLNKTIYS